MRVTLGLQHITMTSAPKIYYKYLKHEYLQKFFASGVIRIGTLFDFRNEEMHGTQIGDDEEGVKSANKVINWFGGPKDQPEFDKKFINVQEDYVRITNISVREETRSDNLYVFSVSGTFSLEIMKKMNPEYDACIAIEKPKRFFQAIAIRMKSRAHHSVFGRCVYSNRHMPHDQQHQAHPGWLKDPEYEYQDEYRLLMTTKLNEIEPINIYCKYAAKNYCSIKYMA